MVSRRHGLDRIARHVVYLSIYFYPSIDGHEDVSTENNGPEHTWLDKQQNHVEQVLMTQLGIETA